MDIRDFRQILYWIADSSQKFMFFLNDIVLIRDGDVPVLTAWHMFIGSMILGTLFLVLSRVFHMNDGVGKTGDNSNTKKPTLKVR